MTVNCFDPGPTETTFGQTAGGAMQTLQRVVGFLGILHSAEVGAQTGVYLASSPATASVSGTYLGHNGRPRKSSPVTYDREVAKRLWSVSEALCGVIAAGVSAPAGRADSITN